MISDGARQQGTHLTHPDAVFPLHSEYEYLWSLQDDPTRQETDSGWMSLVYWQDLSKEQA